MLVALRWAVIVAPEQDALHHLVRSLPKDRRAMWQTKDKITQAEA